MDTKTKLEIMRLSRRLAYLKRCIDVLALLEKYENETTVRSRIFQKYIKPEMKFSYVTFNNMLNEKNPAKEIAEICEKIDAIKLRACNESKCA